MLSEKPWRLDAVILFFAAVLASLFLGMTAVELLRRASVPGFQQMESPGGIVMATFCFQGVICILMLVFLRLHRVGWADALGLRGPHLKRAIGIAAVTVLIILPVVWMLQGMSVQVLENLGWKTGDQVAVSLLKKIRSDWLRVYLGVFTVIIAPVAEEFAFRGMLYPVIKQLGFPRLAVFGGSLLFAAIHLDLAILPSLFVLSLCLTWLYEETDNLMAPIAAHMLFNGINLIRLIVALYSPRAGTVMNEFELIQKLTRGLPTNGSVTTGAGDDCAVLDIGLPDRVLLFKTDAVVEGIHFKADTLPEKIGRKALARCLSDIAAMAGSPSTALVTLALPERYNDPAFVEAVYDGMNALARQHEVAIAGGETTTNPERMLISIALIGFAPRGKAVLRSGAKTGDAIFVTGELGGSISGRHLDFEPRLAEARWIAKHFSIHAMIDLSDGLAGDLRHILRASGAGAELLTTSIPISRAAKLAGRAGSAAKPPLVAALSDGEDFELLFTVASCDAVPLLDAWKKEFPGLRLTCIGKIVTGDGITLRDARGARPLTAQGFEHFKS